MASLKVDQCDVTQGDVTVADDVTTFRDSPQKISSYVEQAMTSQSQITSKFNANYVTMDYLDKFDDVGADDDVMSSINSNVDVNCDVREAPGSIDDLYNRYVTSQNANNCNNNGNQKNTENFTCAG